jgi:hypothetical protein
MTEIMRKFGSIAALLCAVAVTSCDKTAVQDITGPLPTARVKFFNFGPGTPGVNFYANDTKMTAISSTTGTESTNGVTYGNAGNGAFYSAIAPGAYTLTGRIAATTDKDLVVASAPATIADGKAYSFYISGPYSTTTKTAEAFVVEDDYPAAIDYSVAMVRFVNASANSSPMTLYGTNTATTPASPEVAIGGPVAYKSAGAFTAIPGGVYNLATRVAGSSSNVLTRTGVSFSNGRVYTITFRGTVGTSSTLLLDNTINR